MADEPLATPPPTDGDHDGYLRLGVSGSDPQRDWQQARTRCTACGSEGLLSPGYLEDTGQGAHGDVRWVDAPRDPSFLGGLTTLGAARFRVRASRCTECNHIELYAEPMG